VVGFWQHVVEKRVNLTLKTETTPTRAPSVIVYIPSGDEVNLRFPVVRNQQGQETTTLVTMKRLSGEKDMLLY
jgi:hypothetical protein